MSRQLASIALGLLLVPSLARADPFVEGAVGFVNPVADGTWGETVDTSLKLAIRGGTLGDRVHGPGLRGGLELSLDWSPLEDEDAWAVTGGGLPEASVDSHRLRGLVGARLARGLGARAIAFVRAGVGVDYITAETTGMPGGDVEESSVGMALEGGAGLAGRIGNVSIGAQVGVPIGIHDDDDGQTLDLDYLSIDIDLLFTVGTVWW